MPASGFSVRDLYEAILELLNKSFSPTSSVVSHGGVRLSPRRFFRTANIKANHALKHSPYE